MYLMPFWLGSVEKCMGYKRVHVWYLLRNLRPFLLRDRIEIFLDLFFHKRLDNVGAGYDYPA
jgi:hypothetical protein